MSSNQESIELAAADWLARRDAGFAPDDATAFEAWLARDPRHFAAVAQLESAWDLINRPRTTGRADDVLHDLHARARARSRRRIALASASLAAAAALVVAFVPLRRAAPAPVSTVVARPEQQVLPDGSVIQLNAGAEVVVEFTPEIRGVRLQRGEAHFQVAKNPARPFIVTAQGVQVKAVGTAFTVRSSAREIDVLVTEGKVAVDRTVGPSLADVPGSNAQLSTLNSQLPTGTSQVFLIAGQSTVVPLEELAAVPAVQQVTPAEMTAALAWRGKRVEFVGTSLGEAVALFNRENNVQLAFADNTLADQQVGGIFWADDPEGFVRLLEGSFGIKATRSGNQIILHR